MLAGMRDSEIASCPVSAFTGDPATCRWCATPLPLTKKGKVPRNRRWCGDGCSRAFWANHMWQLARDAALRRDGWTCAGCGQVGWRDVPRDVLRIDQWPVETGRPADEHAWTAALGWVDEHDARGAWPGSGAMRRLHEAEQQLPDSIRQLVAREHRMGRRRPMCARRGRDLEVNHVEPRRGQGYSSGCHNHLDNLQTLCRACHVAVTAEQRRARARGRDDVITSPPVRQPSLLEHA